MKTVKEFLEEESINEKIDIKALFKNSLSKFKKKEKEKMRIPTDEEFNIATKEANKIRKGSKIDWIGVESNSGKIHWFSGTIGRFIYFPKYKDSIRIKDYHVDN